MNLSTRVTLVLLSAAGLASGVWAQGSQPEPTLEGPKVKDNGIPNQTRKFAGGVNADRKAAAAERGTPQRLFMRALDAIRGDKAAENIRLTAEQESKIKAINEEFATSQREYFRAHKAEIESMLAGLPEAERRRVSSQFQGIGPELKGRAIERIAGDKPARGKKPPAEQQADKPADMPAEEMMPADAKAKEAQATQNREKLKALYEGMPQPKDVQTKVWGILTEAQRPIVQAELDKAKKEMEARVKAAANGAPKAIDAARPSAAKDQISDEDLAKLDLPERVKERLKGMTPQERPAALERMKERLKNEGQGRRPAAGGQDKPAPSSKDVNVPAPR